MTTDLPAAECCGGAHAESQMTTTSERIIPRLIFTTCSPAYDLVQHTLPLESWHQRKVDPHHGHTPGSAAGLRNFDKAA